MKSKILRQKLPNKGFTLLELLVVVVIIGILAAIALPQYQLAVTKAKFATIKNAGEAIAKSVQMFYLSNSISPETLEDLDVEIPGKLSDNNQRIVIDNNKYCFLGYRNSKYQEVNCSFDSSLEYLIVVFYDDGKIKRICRTYNTNQNTIQHKLCKQETKLSEPSRCEDEQYHYCNYNY